MHIHYKNFGPISEGFVNLRPLTILIGDNQAGKSFAAMAAHACMRGIGQPSYGWYDRTLYGRARFRYWGDYGPETQPSLFLKNIHTQLQESDHNTFIEFPAKDLIELESYTNIGSAKSLLVSAVTDVFSTECKELIRYGETEGEIEIADDQWYATLRLKSGQVHTSFDLSTQVKLHIGYADRRRKDYSLPRKGETIAFKPSQRAKHADFNRFVHDLQLELREIVKVPPTFRSPKNSIYIPAIRSGLLMSHRLFLSLLVRNVHRIGFEPFSVPQMTGVTADFLQSLLLQPDYGLHTPSKSKSDQSFRQFEEAITGGHVYFQQKGSEEIAGVYYRTKEGLEIPLNLTSSTVTEVAPLFLLLRELRSPKRTVLIVEEPESHLSPKNQILMAEFLAQLVNAGIQVIITTHSSFLLDSINNLILRHQANSETISLDPAIVSAHVASRTPDNCSTIKPLEIDPNEGIVADNFLMAYQRLYDESFSLKQQIEST